jgi:hypothetical protein
MGDVVSDVMTQAAATSFIHMQVFDASHTSHSIRNVALRRGSHAEALSMRGSSGAGRFSLINL